MRHLIVGTAGHIDHGKSALVEALSGIHPDRLEEEKRRGITIDLGFADFEVEAGRVVSFVDVPGHERFVRHMVAGAGGIGAVLLVVAADEGVMPQTREHLDICSLLGVRHGAVALTKTDLVDAEVIEVVTLEIREFLAGSFLETASVVPVSARTGQGLPALRACLASLFDVVPERPVEGVARLGVDRVFVIRGFGSVVTGTLVSGALSEGEEVAILPGNRRAKIRGLQVHRHRVQRALAGQRVAVNLQGVSVEEVPRGSTLTLPGGLVTTRRAWCRLRWLEDAPEAIRAGGVMRFHQGTCERTARVRVLAPADGGALHAEIVLAEETVLMPGDRFILRRPAPVDTVGGGVVLDVRPPRVRSAAARGLLTSLEGVGAGVLMRLEVAGAAGRESSGLAAELGLSPPELDARLAELVRAGDVVRAGSCLFHAGTWSRIESAALEALRQFHASEPLRAGMLREELRGRVARQLPAEAWRGMLAALEGAGRVRLAGDRLAIATHRVRLSEGDLEMARRVEARFRDAGLDPPGPSDVLPPDAGERGARILEWLVAEGRLVRIRDGRLFHGEALLALRRKLREYAKISSSIDVAAFKDLAGVTRRNAIPLLEHFDGERVTRRVGNVREILPG